jgi:hypothetical protein
VRYEVVHSGRSSPIIHTAPFSNNTHEWHRATAAYGKPTTGPPRAALGSDGALRGLESTKLTMDQQASVNSTKLRVF